MPMAVTGGEGSAMEKAPEDGRAVNKGISVVSDAKKGP